VADAHPDDRRGREAGRGDLEPDPPGVEGMTAISLDEAQAILADRNLIAVGARGDEARRRRHGNKTTFVRVFEVHTDALRLGSGQAIPASARPGEIRVTGKPPSVAAAVASITAVRALAGPIPVSAYSLDDLLDLAGGGLAGLTDLVARLAAAGLEIIAEAAVDRLPDAAGAIRAARNAGVQVPRLTVRELAAGDELRFVTLARDIQASIGGVRAFAPLARVSAVAQPSTGYDDVKQIAVARLLADNIESIQVDWALYGPKLAQVALTMGADDVDAVSALEGDLGRRRSPIEEIRGNITAAGLEPVERDARFRPRSAE
jgi:aminodeoxyfutalosine synthase